MSSSKITVHSTLDNKSLSKVSQSTESKMLASKKVTKSKAKSEAEPAVDAASEKPRTFLLFPKLPVELRAKIWGYACSITRNVDIWARSLDVQLRYSYERPLFFYSSLPPPSVLHVNSESRSESLKYFNLDFGTNSTIRSRDSAPFTISSPSRVYFNWKTDRLCLVNPSELVDRTMARRVSSQLADYYRDCQKKGLRHFAINIGSLSPFLSEQGRIKDSTFLKHIPRNPKLEEVVLFESSSLVASDYFKLSRLELEDMGFEEQGQRMRYAKKVLEKLLKEDLEDNGDESGRGTPLIRTCKVNFEVIW
ncbi:hypothetical protein NA56DRAFT_656237 [Hyaloscypha hepaticicola]|uniref:2EXR domain-containing protein n=1 Tax=Hyaloscypha hepaticicola TaxID=2082293 RepID=A0A2J6QE36_9HELO|nr:hypothetical protein NA56DRAFT_656237 [Hyaloscypha hepaticicola]